ncbi:AI-2E family transporter [Bradyrhizobium yuanmingense]|uniref:AI-2E family transporter n=1 Tax=Bradyrhizobium TaxID=374 RepID=UPI000D670BBB|nr:MULTISPECIES: AI-2E family transporter [unclassified Bradyrhizobium]MCA1392815.1 AI-2E family transporter [Bradyrhizobium sp. IC3123]MCA1410943.1 AI-2E family transporter [Bradyrhizobium sp. NBAIM20]MCA1461768.1 AI-2E family transporter [Bradyrhizobium sp. NBAIM18]MCA1512400.1 AI-2E family transporter [Bradyrhizobium sp. NBAIM01]PWE80864.1 permease [Bradyrhizobium sp. SUTN9-2]
MSDARVGSERVRGLVRNESPIDDSVQSGRPSLLAIGLTVLVVAVALFLVWQTVSSLLIVFAGVLFAAFLDAAARALAPVLPLSRVWRLTLVLLLLSALAGFGLAWGTGKLPEQTRVLLKVMDAQVDILQEHLLSYGVDLLGPEWGRDFAQWLFADQGRFLSHAQFLLGGASSLLTAVLVILFLGILFAFDPISYRDSVVVLVRQSYRARAREVMDEMGTVMRLWFVGQLIRIILMTLFVWLALYLIGLPGPFVLGLQAGLSNFIPYLGPIVAAIPIALVAMPLGASPLIWAVAVYTIIQSIEGYVIGPLIQRHAVETPPAWTLVAIVLLGALFGVMGIALAMPLVAVGRVAIIRLYVEDYLGDRIEPATTDPPILGEQP